MTDDREATVRMCHQMQRTIDDLEGHGGSEEDPLGTPVRRADEKNYFAARRNLRVRKAWITTGEKPAVHDINRIEMQALLRDLAWASNGITRTQHPQRVSSHGVHGRRGPPAPGCHHVPPRADGDHGGDTGGRRQWRHLGGRRRPGQHPGGRPPGGPKPPPGALPQASGKSLRARQQVAVGDPRRRRPQGAFAAPVRRGGGRGEDEAAGNR